MRDEVLKQLKEIKKGSVDLITEDDLIVRIERSVEKKTPIRVKLGIDPTAPDIHLGHSVILNKLRQIQDFGHTAVLIIGDYTARIGDPSGRSETRPQLTPEMIDQNARTYVKQVFKILDKNRTEIRFNSEWLSSLKLEDVIKLTSKFTIARLLERDDFHKRYTENNPISLMEMLYPIMQGYDSVAVKSGIELGGTEQKFNLLIGRDLQKEFGQIPQMVLTMPILVGIDGVNRMSKSLGNYVGINEDPNEIFGKLMSIPDSVMGSYYKLVSTLSSDEIDHLLKEMELNKINPSLLKRKLARDIVAKFYNQNEAIKAEKEFDRIFKGDFIPSKIETFPIKASGYPQGRIWSAELFVLSGFASTNSEAIRLIDNRGTAIADVTTTGSLGQSIDYNSKSDIPISELNGKILRVGKRRFKKIQIIR